MVAIITKYVGPTNHRGSRIIVKSNAGKVSRISVSYDHALDIEENHIAAAHEYARRNDWLEQPNCCSATTPCAHYGRLAHGATADGYAFVFVKDPQCKRCNAIDVARAVGPSTGGL